MYMYIQRKRIIICFSAMIKIQCVKVMLLLQVATEDDVFLGGETFANIMNPWVHQMGLPVITVTIAAGQITCVQARFMNNEDINPEEPPSEYGYGNSDMVWCSVVWCCVV